jgi:hypothetical protein
MIFEHAESERLLDSAGTGGTELEAKSRTIPCRQMTEFIVLQAIRRVPSELRDQVESHIAECKACRKKSLALRVASEAVSRWSSPTGIRWIISQSRKE